MFYRGTPFTRAYFFSFCRFLTLYFTSVLLFMYEICFIFFFFMHKNIRLCLCMWLVLVCLCVVISCCHVFYHQRGSYKLTPSFSCMCECACVSISLGFIQLGCMFSYVIFYNFRFNKPDRNCVLFVIDIRLKAQITHIEPDVTCSDNNNNRSTRKT